MSEDGLFKKSIASDLDSDQIVMLLTEQVQNPNNAKEGWNTFSEKDLFILAQAFTVLKFGINTRIMQKGEPSTFFAVILQGACIVRVSPTLDVTLRTGTVIGEMSFFSDGRRNAEVKTQTSVVLAIMTYQELRNLHLLSGSAQSKLIAMLARMSLRKQRKNLAPDDEEQVEDVDPDQKLTESLFVDLQKKNAGGPVVVSQTTASIQIQTRASHDKKDDINWKDHDSLVKDVMRLRFQLMSSKSELRTAEEDLDGLKTQMGLNAAKLKQVMAKNKVLETNTTSLEENVIRLRREVGNYAKKYGVLDDFSGRPDEHDGIRMLSQFSGGSAEIKSIAEKMKIAVKLIIAYQLRSESEYNGFVELIF
jgi:CRP-like cAMP-binding protein